MSDLKMPSGKYMGERIEDLPSGYLKWVAYNWDDDEIAAAADDEWWWREDTNEHFYE